MWCGVEHSMPCLRDAVEREVHDHHHGIERNAPECDDGDDGEDDNEEDDGHGDHGQLRQDRHH
jgi:hypothetical protein